MSLNCSSSSAWFTTGSGLAFMLALVDGVESAPMKASATTHRKRAEITARTVLSVFMVELYPILSQVCNQPNLRQAKVFPVSCRFYLFGNVPPFSPANHQRPSG